MPTDTIYGIVGRALDKNAVERIYKIRKRAPEKPCIVLIGEISVLLKFGINLTKAEEKTIEECNEPTSFIVDCPDEKFSYLHRGTQTLAVRLPAPQQLRNLLVLTGPLIAPSANPEGLPPARNIEEAKVYFGDLVDPVRGRESSQRPSTSNGVDLYVDGGELAGKPSKLIRLHSDGTATVLRI